MSFRHLGARLSSSRPPVQDAFDLHADRCTKYLEDLLLFSCTPQASIHVEYNGTIQTRTVYGIQPQRSSFTSSPDRSQPTAYPTTPAPPDPSIANASHTAQETSIHELGSNTIYAIASYTKILINVAYYRLISQGRYRNQGLSWGKSACDLLNELRRAKGKTLVRRFARDPTFIELLHHRNSFAPMNRFLLAPDETFLMSQDEFLEFAPLITEDYFKGEKQGWGEYSNANHIFAAIILEELTKQNLHEIMQEVVFDPFQMTHTVMDRESLDRLEAAGAIIANGHRVLGDMRRCVALPNQRYLADTVEVASLGARSSTGDLAKLIREFLKALDDSSSQFQERDTLYFFGPKGRMHEVGLPALGGWFCDVDSTSPGSESLNRRLVPPNGFPPYRLGKRPNGSSCPVYYKAGSIDGFTSSIYVSLKRRLFVIVLANSTGPVDVTDHISRYILQAVLNLLPEVDILCRATAEGLQASERVQDFERIDADVSAWSDVTERFVGTYRHTKYGQELEVTTEGNVILHGRCKGRSKASSPMTARVAGDTMRIFPGSDGFGIDRWTVWDNRDFRMDQRDGEFFLVGNAGKDHYKRISVP